MTLQELRERQRWTLTQKVDHTLGVIDQFVSRMDGKVYLAFSGGKDSTVLMHLCEMIKPDIQCVFVNTGCESPSVVGFVKQVIRGGHNVLIIRPKMTPKQVWERYGFPLVSKEFSDKMSSCRRNPSSVRSMIALGTHPSKRKNMFEIANRWRYFIDEPYDVSNMCCTKLKKDPSHAFNKETGLSPIVGTMASESMLREKTYIRRGGCNVFGENAMSLPLSIWTDDDIWSFIGDRGIEIADCYYQGCQRTGCVACGFGVQFANDTRLRFLYDHYPKYYHMVMGFTNHGVTYREALRKMLAVNGLFLPDESPQLELELN